MMRLPVLLLLREGGCPRTRPVSGVGIWVDAAEDFRLHAPEISREGLVRPVRMIGGSAERLAAVARLLSPLQNGTRVREGPIQRRGNVQPCCSAQKADCERACALYFAIISRME